MAARKRIWFKPLKLPNQSVGWSIPFIPRPKPTGHTEYFLVPCTWQGWIITAIATSLGYGAARLSLYLYPIKAEYGLAGWVGFAIIVLLTLHIATTFSNRP